MRNFLCFLVLCFCIFAVGKARLSRGSETADALLSIMVEFDYQRLLAETWRGNPCHDEWYGISCEEGEIKSITLISLNLTGSISPRFADLTSVNVIDLSHNLLTGTIPVELTKMNLSILDLSYNNLHGKVPHFETVVPNTEGNPKIVTSNTHVPFLKGNKTKAVVLGLFIGMVVLGLLLIGGCIVYYRVMERNRSDNDRQPEQNDILEVENKAIPMQILRNSTDDFSRNNLLGRGGFGSVYKGKLQDGTIVAVKRMNQSAYVGKGIDQFNSEVSVLTRVRHRNLVFLHGYCIQGNERLLVYEYMPQGTLSRHLFQWKDEGLRPLDWTRRLSVALDVARGVEYLHTLARECQSYIHRDLKPSNILLGEDLRAKVSDLGLVRSTVEGEESIRTKCVGTPGHMAPEYAMTGRLTRKVDVYSFGVILMELLTGQEAVDEKRPEDDTFIVDWLSRMFSEKNSILMAIDETIEVNEATEPSIKEISALASHCCANQPEQRPDMAHVVKVIFSLVEDCEVQKAINSSSHAGGAANI